MRKQRFYTWLRGYSGNNTPMGDFARDVIGDNYFPKVNNFDIIHNYLVSKKACPEAIKIFMTAYIKWENSNKQ